jgi:hypothetical protein
MHFVSVNKFYDFMQVISSIGEHPTKNEYFSMHILFSIIYLMQK